MHAPPDHTSIQYLKGVGPARARLFANLGVETVEDLLYLFPRRYEDRTQITPIAQSRVGEFQTVTGKVKKKGARRSWYTKKHVYELVVDDGSGRIFAVWFNQPYLDRYFKDGAEVVLFGKVEVFKNRLQIMSPEYELLDRRDDNLNVGRVVPVYPLTRGISQRGLRRAVRNALDHYLGDVKDLLPDTIRRRHKLLPIARSLENIHFPESAAIQQDAHRRVSFEEFFFFQVSVLKRRMSIVHKQGIAHTVSPDILRGLQERLPFDLTGAQQRVMHQIAQDMQAPQPMLRLLQGDVGSGKTLVALYACLIAAANGRQAAIMAPTEILARQHYENIKKALGGAGVGVQNSEPLQPLDDGQLNKKIIPARQTGVGTGRDPSLLAKNLGPQPVLLIGSMKKKDRESAETAITSGEAGLIVGTHALLNSGLAFNNLSLVVIDEQHKFGVKQRALLSGKGGNPDVLVMTATPIPRTLSLTLFGDLDVSVIDEMPPGRGTIKTRCYPPEHESGVYRFVRDKVKAGMQAYIIYPLIEESDKSDLKAAQAMYDRFVTTEFQGLQLGLIHGRLKRSETETIMQDFKAGTIQILVATTVIEVGVDVPSANIMVIEHAERFGLAQLHQLRGRVGRGQENAYCLLIAEPGTEEGAARLQAMMATTDGFKIAEQDLIIRGPGHYFGRHQHGLNELRFANPATQVDILEEAREEAKDLIHHDPHFQEPDHRHIEGVIRHRFPEYLSMIQAG